VALILTVSPSGFGRFTRVSARKPWLEILPAQTIRADARSTVEAARRGSKFERRPLVLPAVIT
jgi:hypothetical protein